MVNLVCKAFYYSSRLIELPGMVLFRHKLRLNRENVFLVTVLMISIFL